MELRPPPITEAFILSPNLKVIWLLSSERKKIPKQIADQEKRARGKRRGRDRGRRVREKGGRWTKATESTNQETDQGAHELATE